MLNPCSDQSCEWIQGETSYNASAGTGGWLKMTGRRWYPMVEVLEDGSLIVIGGDMWGGYVNMASQDNPTYEYFPPKGDGLAINLQFLTDCLPTNLYALTWLMPSGRLFMQANLKTILLNHTDTTTINLPDMPFATRVYPASAATAMLPLTPDNNYEATLLFCGGSNVTQWGQGGSPGYNITAVPADNTCVRISPESNNPQYVTDDHMASYEPFDAFLLFYVVADLNSLRGEAWANSSTSPTAPSGSVAGLAWAPPAMATTTTALAVECNMCSKIGQFLADVAVAESYGQAPLYMPAIYNYSAPAGQRWNRTGLVASKNERMYHSTSVLLPDSSILISGSNPNADFTNDQWRSRTDIERWYPWYYNNPRPMLSNAPNNLTYGGAPFDIPLGSITDEGIVQSAKIVLIRGSFHTHVVGFGYVSLSSAQVSMLKSCLPPSAHDPAAVDLHPRHEFWQRDSSRFAASRCPRTNPLSAGSCDDVPRRRGCALNRPMGHGR